MCPSHIPPDQTSAPTDRPQVTLDVRSLGPPHPLKQTLERLAEIPEETVLLQRNDRTPQFLFPKLRDRGYTYDTLERDGEVLTIIWKE
ncbi:DUF2249 domain-containing protein [Halobacteria archaeon AArc-curdl1]|uniref:DUF2249 domain-containing protein n=1 Tax=Natronosalvus hydrolyticus TaxID=2979988 RepID=A0AAP2ZAN0_9EURY|nr:DUF2249 domain-containing protein [Halobacteria archaeon AArc-curdl1]